jgi:hypothetical protein
MFIGQLHSPWPRDIDRLVGLHLSMAARGWTDIRDNGTVTDAVTGVDADL